MKRGFALLETIIVITFVLVSLLLLYKTVGNMYQNTQENLIYDNVSDIYKTYYLKEYLRTNNLIKDDNVYTCSNLDISNCNELFKELNLNKIYIINEVKDNFNDSIKKYFNTLTKNKKYFIGEFINNESFSYASIELEGEDYE